MSRRYASLRFLVVLVGRTLHKNVSNLTGMKFDSVVLQVSGHILRDSDFRYDQMLFCSLSMALTPIRHLRLFFITYIPSSS